MITLRAKTSNQINYKSDFEIAFVRIDHRGNPLPAPSCDWSMKIWTDDYEEAAVVYCKGDQYHNCYCVGDELRLVNDHNLRPGALKVEYIEYDPHDMASDKILTQVIPIEMDITLVDGPSYYSETLVTHLPLKEIKGDKGDPFTFEDYTPEQIEILQKPALDAAKVADDATKKAEAATKRANDTSDSLTSTIDSVVEAEKIRVANEESRIAEENTRKSNEATRIAQEESRVKAEEARKTAESSRVAAEKSRSDAEATRTTSEDVRVANEDKRVSAEKARETTFTTLKANAEQATSDANKAATNAQTVADGVAGELIKKAEKTELSNVLSRPSDKTLEAIEPNVVSEALRKVPQELSDAEKAQVLENLGNPEFKTFVDLWNKACEGVGTYNSNTGFFELNGLTDIDYNEAVVIYSRSLLLTNSYISNWCLTMGRRIRTNIPFIGRILNGTLGLYQCQIEVLKLHKSDYPATCVASNFNIESVIKVLTPIQITDGYPVDKHPWGANLEMIFLNSVKGDVDFGNSPKISLESFQYLVTKAVNPSSITITVHPDVFAKLTDESNTEWHKVLTDAAAKNIQFASA